MAKTFKEFLAEEQKIEMFSDLVFQHCRPFLEESKGNGFLYRGVKGLSDAESYSASDADGEEMEYAVKRVRQDRRPLDITRERAKMMDDWFDERFGIKARSQCVFALGEKADDADLVFYGKPCVIFPVGPIEYVWSPDVQDLYSDLDIYTDTPGEVKDGSELESRIRRWLDSRKYKSTGMSEAVTMRHEIMVKCSSYYAFPIEYRAQLKRALGMR